MFANQLALIWLLYLIEWPSWCLDCVLIKGVKYYHLNFFVAINHMCMETDIQHRVLFLILVPVKTQRSKSCHYSQSSHDHPRDPSEVIKSGLFV